MSWSELLRKYIHAQREMVKSTGTSAHPENVKICRELADQIKIALSFAQESA